MVARNLKSHGLYELPSRLRIAGVAGRMDIGFLAYHMLLSLVKALLIACSYPLVLQGSTGFPLVFRTTRLTRTMRVEITT